MLKQTQKSRRSSQQWFAGLMAFAPLMDCLCISSYCKLYKRKFSENGCLLADNHKSSNSDRRIELIFSISLS